MATKAELLKQAKELHTKWEELTKQVEEAGLNNGEFDDAETYMNDACTALEEADEESSEDKD